MSTVTRRFFLNRMFESTLFSVLSLYLSCAKTPESLSLLFLEAVIGRLKEIKAQESSNIIEAANLIADSVISKNHSFIYLDNYQNAGYLGEINSSLPDMFINLRSKAMAETLNEGDTLLTTSSGDIPATAKKRGAFIVAITSPAFIDGYEPSLHAYLASKQELGKMADVLISSHLPVWDGLVEIEEYPFGILPGSGIILPAIINAVAGESYKRSGSIGRIDNSPPQDALAFIDTVIERSEFIKTGLNAIRETGVSVAEKLIAGKKVWIYDRDAVINRQISSGAGVPAFINRITGEGIVDGTLKSGDCFILSSSTHIKSREYELISAASEITDMIVMLSPRGESGGLPLYNKMILMDNLSPENEGVLTFDNGMRKFLLTGEIMNSILFWMLIAETVDCLIKSGNTPYLFMGRHLADSGGYNEEIEKFAQGRDF